MSEDTSPHEVERGALPATQDSTHSAGRSAAEAVATSGCVVAIAMIGLLQERGALLPLLAVAALAASVVSRSARSLLAASVTLFWVGAGWLFHAWWPLSLVVTVFGTALLLWASPRLRRAAPWIRIGHADRTTLALAAREHRS